MKLVLMKRLSLAAAVVVLLLIVTSPITTIWLIKQQAVSIVSVNLQGLSSSSLATMNVSEGFLQTALAVNGGETEREALPEILRENTALVDTQYDAHRETLRTDLERSLFKELLQSREVYRTSRKSVIDLLEARKQVEASAFFKDDCTPKFHAYSETLGNVVERDAKEAKVRGAEIIKLCYVLLAMQVLLFVFFFVYGFFVPLTALLERLTRRPVVFNE